MSPLVRVIGFVCGFAALMFLPDRLPVTGAMLISLCLLWPEKRRRRKVVRIVATNLSLEETIAKHCIATGKVCWGHVNKDGSYTIEELGN